MVNLRMANLRMVNLRMANLRMVNLRMANLRMSARIMIIAPLQQSLESKGPNVAA
ncbi:hypothetical protein BU25DRAFT_453616 [Macroventuria anomochaeta]|uniref:Uncharacterized protein n=1 Tax=Macroventuria anomochaeta TaxID=301207 RepID=A0ACB6SHZ2_9PLEO|nr:uncharacterized protein BU25DRAFT_453616 [Macroventuria anomochaeta]KAF2633905.1 hypothetical protein BU25DRAFT_453616 [Macroventuria anomochaeta]